MFARYPFCCVVLSLTAVFLVILSWESYLKAVFELPTDKVEGNGVNAGVQGSHVDADVIHY